MLKHKMKQWLSDHQPEALRCGAKAEPSSPTFTSTTPPLRESPSAATGATTNKISAGIAEGDKSPSNSTVNQYPSLKSKILGPKMAVGASSPSSNVSINSSKENRLDGAAAAGTGSGGAGGSLLGKSFASTTNLAAAAALATGLHSKRKRDDSPVKPSPIKIVRVKEDYDYNVDAPAPAPAAVAPALAATTTTSSKPSSHSSQNAFRLAESAVKNEEKNEVEEEAAPVEETDDDLARRLHQELNCAPVRTSRSRRHTSCAQETVMEDPVHGQDPGILPSC